MTDRSLILCPSRVSLNRILTSIHGEDVKERVKTFDVKAALGKNRLFINTGEAFFLFCMKPLTCYFLKLANELIMAEVSAYRPGIVIVTTTISVAGDVRQDA